MRKYIYSIVEGYRSSSPRFHLYISAIRRFSLRELFAKQLWALMHLEELPFNEFTVTTAAAREGTTHIVVIQSPSSSAFHYGRITVKKEVMTVEIHRDYVLEFVFYSKEHVEPFLQLVKNKWKGEWELLSEEHEDDKYSLEDVAKDIRNISAGIGWYDCEGSKKRLWKWTEKILSDEEPKEKERGEA